MTAPMPPGRLAEIEACASPHLAAMLAEERPDSAVMHRIELLAEVKRLTEQVAELQAQLDQTRTVLPAEFLDALTADEEPRPVPAPAVCGAFSKPQRYGGILGPCIDAPGHGGNAWHRDASGATWNPTIDGPAPAGHNPKSRLPYMEQ